MQLIIMSAFDLYTTIRPFSLSANILRCGLFAARFWRLKNAEKRQIVYDREHNQASIDIAEACDVMYQG